MMFLLEFRFPGLLSTHTTGGAQVQFLASATTFLTSIISKKEKRKVVFVHGPQKKQKHFTLQLQNSQSLEKTTMKKIKRNTEIKVQKATQL